MKKTAEASGSLAPSSAEARHLPVYFVPCFRIAGSLPPFDQEQLTKAQRGLCSRLKLTLVVRAGRIRAAVWQLDRTFTALCSSALLLCTWLSVYLWRSNPEEFPSLLFRLGFEMG